MMKKMDGEYYEKKAQYEISIGELEYAIHLYYQAFEYYYTKNNYYKLCAGLKYVITILRQIMNSTLDMNEKIKYIERIKKTDIEIAKVYELEANITRYKGYDKGKYHLNKYDESVNLYNLAFEIYEKHNCYERLAFGYRIVGNINYQSAMVTTNEIKKLEYFNLSEKYLIKSHEQFSKLNKDVISFYVQKELLDVYQQAENYENYLFLARKLLKISSDNHNTGGSQNLASYKTDLINNIEKYEVLFINLSKNKIGNTSSVNNVIPNNILEEEIHEYISNSVVDYVDQENISIFENTSVTAMCLSKDYDEDDGADHLDI